jgi:hypothetical protein
MGFKGLLLKNMSTVNGKRKKASGRGGFRRNSGRPKKVNPDNYVQVTCVLRKDTVEQLRAGAGGKQKFFGAFLQFHLDRFPLPTHEEYVAMRDNLPMTKTLGPKRRNIPVVFAGNLKQARHPRIAKERAPSEATQKFLEQLA